MRKYAASSARCFATYKRALHRACILKIAAAVLVLAIHITLLADKIMASKKLIEVLKEHGYLNCLSVGGEECQDESEVWIPAEDAEKSDFESHKKTFKQGEHPPVDWIRIPAQLKIILKKYFPC